MHSTSLPHSGNSNSQMIDRQSDSNPSSSMSLFDIPCTGDLFPESFSPDDCSMNSFMDENDLDLPVISPPCQSQSGPTPTTSEPTAANVKAHQPTMNNHDVTQNKNGADTKQQQSPTSNNVSNAKKNMPAPLNTNQTHKPFSCGNILVPSIRKMRLQSNVNSTGTPVTPLSATSHHTLRSTTSPTSLNSSCTPTTPGSAKRKVTDFSADPPSKNIKRSHAAAITNSNNASPVSINMVTVQLGMGGSGGAGSSIATLRANGAASLGEPLGEQHYAKIYNLTSHLETQTAQARERIVKSVITTRDTWEKLGMSEASSSPSASSSSLVGEEFHLKRRQNVLMMPQTQESSSLAQQQTIVIESAIDAEDVLDSMMRNTLNFLGHDHSQPQQQEAQKPSPDALVLQHQMCQYVQNNREQLLSSMCCDNASNGQVLDYQQLKNQVLSHDKFPEVYSGIKSALDNPLVVKVDENELINNLMQSNQSIQQSTPALSSAQYLIEMNTQDALKVVHSLSIKGESSSSQGIDLKSLENIQIPPTVDTSLFIDRFESLQKQYSQEVDLVFQTQMYWIIKYDTVLNEHAIVRHVTQYERDYVYQSINIKFQLLVQQLKEKYQEKVVSLKDLLLIKTRRRGNLPKHATNILKNWLFANFLHPYPSESEKIELAKKTQLTMVQISNWFINARVRTWRPMLESMLSGEGKCKTKNDPQLQHLQNLTPGQITAALNSNGQEAPRPQTEAPCGLPQK